MLNCSKITAAIVVDRYRRSFVLPNYTPVGWWENDVIERTGAGYWNEYEIKITKQDFAKDSAKERGVSVVRNKWNELEWTDKGPNRFWFVVPEGMLSMNDIPSWAGWMEARESRSGRVALSVVKKAVVRHRKKMDPAIEAHARSVIYYRLMSKIIRLA